MSRAPRIVAELGRPETPDETAARKAEASQVYRSSQTFRNLIAALIVTVGVVAVIVFAVPRGEPAPRPAIDLSAVAADVESTMDREVLVPEVADGWRVNAAELDSGATVVWDIVMVPAKRGFVHVAQAFDADARWAPQVLSGVAPTDAVTIDGREWDVYEVADPSRNANVSYALGTQAGPDYVLLYGSLSPEATAELAESLSPQIRTLSEAE
ncbi:MULTISPECIES: DUF4245 domain-containing protein [Microbacterium]|uniref:DUF4245 domain-containing protein n=1 Tax=Microbacterium TaxID=33882 RepID=UPI00217E24BA|nr:MULTISPECIES: DUF4245 domain-containing protein [Microbacterium]UWF78074.1 DUF4245 domain-containing protein [Microbacterium neungamense]WCM56252.1 DUF4245 domain-containing protein [Microbacterium sp. EF45047]